MANALKKARQAPEKLEQVSAVSAEPLDGSVGKPVGIHGLLEHLGVSSLLVMIEMERKTGLLKLERPGMSGRIFMREGRVVAARLSGERAPESGGEETGAQAVYLMLSWSTGRFDFTPGPVEMEDEVSSTTTHLLMEGARLIDESRR